MKIVLELAASGDRDQLFYTISTSHISHLLLPDCQASGVGALAVLGGCHKVVHLRQAIPRHDEGAARESEAGYGVCSEGGGRVVL